LASLVLSVPYGGLFAPPAVVRRLGLSAQELGWENFRLADPCLLEAAREAAKESAVKGFLGEKKTPERALAACGFSPLVSDPLGHLARELNKTADGAEEAEEEKAPLFIKRGALGRAFPGWSPEEAEVILQKSALPYLRDIGEKCREKLSSDSLVLLLTLRSYSSRPLDFEGSRKLPRPQVCVSPRDGVKTPSGLASFVGRVFRLLGLWPELGWPHSGAYVPDELYFQPRLFAAGLSFRRDLYMDEASGRPSAGFGPFARLLRTVFSLLEDELESVIRVRRLRRLPPKAPPKAPSMVIKAKNT
jgi:hypothetical protein